MEGERIIMDRAINRLQLPGLALALAALTGCVSNGVPQDQVYRLFGMEEANDVHSRDGIFQDFSYDNGNLGRLWLDTDALQHQGTSKAFVQPWVERSTEEQPFLRVVYDRQGYGTNIAIAAKDNRPEHIDAQSVLAITMRSESDACVGVRVQEADGEIWLYGKEQLDYIQQCVEAGAGWTTFELPLGDESWVRFPYTGNVHLGNNERELALITAVSLEIGSQGKWYLKPGENTLDVKSILIK